MKKILVPVDFSRSSEVAVHFAVELSKLLQAKIELLHVIENVAAKTKLKNWKNLEFQIIETANSSAIKLLQSLGNPKDIKYTNLKGVAFASGVDNYATKIKADLVVVGSRGSGMQKAIFGSNSAALLGRCKTPVLVVPDDASFDGIHKIVLATDMDQLDEQVKTIAKLAKPLDAEIVILHISQGTGKRDRSSLTGILSRMAKYSRLRFESLENEDVTKGIESFVESEKPDLLAMFPRKVGVFDRLFGRSMTRRMAFQHTLPLLAVNKQSK